MKRILFMVLVIGILAGGCAFIKQAKEDYQIGQETALEQGEQSPEEQANAIKRLVQPLPVVGPFAETILPGLVGLFTYLRGRRIRKGKPLNPNPATGFLGNSVGVEAMVQTISNISTGLFEVGPDGSALKRGWKVGIQSALGLLAVALTVPQAQEFFLANPSIFLTISGLSGLFGGVEKQLSIIQPVAPKNN